MPSLYDQLQRAALKVFTEKGYAGTTMAEIAKQADLNVATIYRFFKGKKQLFQALGRPDLNFPDQRERLCREAILQNSLKLFSQQGYTSTTMDNIAEAVGLTKTAIYYYYSSKESLFAAVIENPAIFKVIDSLVSANLPQETDNLEEGLTKLSVVYLSMFDEAEFHSAFKIILSEGFRNPEISRVFRERIVGTGSQNVAKYLQKHLKLEWDDLVINVQALFGSLLSWGIINCLMETNSPSKAERERVAKKYVKLFLFGVQDAIINK